MSILRVSSAAKVSSRRSSRRRSCLLIFLLEALRAATVGMTPEDAAEDLLDEDAEQEEAAVFLLEEVEVRCSATSDGADVLSRVALCDDVGMLP